MPRCGLILLPILLVTGCGTPQDQCIRNATSQVHTLDRLIARSQADLARGYTYQVEERQQFQWIFCGPYNYNGGPSMCFEPVDNIVKVPVAIDPSIEKRKLDNLLAKRESLINQSAAQVAACKTKYPS